MGGSRCRTHAGLEAARADWSTPFGLVAVGDVRGCAPVFSRFQERSSKLVRNPADNPERDHDGLAVRSLMTDVKVPLIDRSTNLPGQCN